METYLQSLVTFSETLKEKASSYSLSEIEIVNTLFTALQVIFLENWLNWTVAMQCIAYLTGIHRTWNTLPKFKNNLFIFFISLPTRLVKNKARKNWEHKGPVTFPLRGTEAPHTCTVYLIIWYFEYWKAQLQTDLETIWNRISWILKYFCWPTVSPADDWSFSRWRSAYVDV